jgi:hypothetical protein
MKPLYAFPEPRAQSEGYPIPITLALLSLQLFGTVAVMQLSGGFRAISGHA